MIEKVEELKCKYLLPCGHCDKFDKMCDHNNVKGTPLKQEKIFIEEVLDTQSETAICIHDWELMNTVSTNTAGYVYRCRKCGATKTEPIISNLHRYTSDYINTQHRVQESACAKCSNHPNNGGSGVCHCILGCPQVTCTTLQSNSFSLGNTDYDSYSTTQYNCLENGGETLTTAPLKMEQLEIEGLD